MASYGYSVHMRRRRDPPFRGPGTLGASWAGEDHAFGKVHTPNETTTTWPQFWAERRLLPSCLNIPTSLARKVEALAGRLNDLLPEHPPPALLHGDLWTGNIVAHGPKVTGLIDPSCYYGHAEVA